MKIRCSVLGQSNSILTEGYFDYFSKHPSIEITKNGRLGASPSLLAPYFCEDSFFLDADYCIIDLCVIDQVMNWAHAVDLYSIAQWLEWLVHQARFAGCQPVFLMIPHEASITNYSPVLHLYRSIAQQQECYFLDMAAIIKDDMEKTGNAAKHYYRDNNHPSPQTSKLIADLLADFLLDTHNTFKPARKVTAFIRNFERVDILPFASADAVVHRENSLMSMDFIRLEEGRAIEIPCGQIERIHGVMVNAAYSFRKLKIVGRNQVTKNLCIYKSNNASDFRAQLIPLLSPIRDFQGKISLSIAKNDEEVSEPTYQAQEPTNQTPSIIEISGLVIERTPSMINYTATIPPQKSIQPVEKRQFAESA